MFKRILLTLFAVAAALMGPAAQAQDAKLTIELNKLEDVENGCRSFFLFRNQTDLTLSEFEMSLAILDSSGVIDRLLTIDAAPLPASRTTLKLFEVPDLTCSGIGEILLHDIAACTPQNGEPMDCFGVINLSSRASVPLVQ